MIHAAQVSRLPPFAKLAVWALGFVLVAGVIQLAAMTLGLNFSVFEKSSGGAVVILTAFGCLLALMAVESRPLADYGLVADAQWLRRGLTGAGIGAGCYLTYLAAAWWLGVVEFHPEQTSGLRWLKTALTAGAAGPVAVTQQIIFSGYLLTTLRDRHAWPIAVGVPALLFALAAGSAATGGLAGESGQRLFVGMFLIQSLLGMLRLRTGSIVLPAGVLAGCILIRKIGSKSRLLGCDFEHANTWWLAPDGDPRQGAAMWALLGVCSVAVAAALWRWGETKLEADSDVDASFKRYMPFSNLLGLAPLDRWVVLLWQARLRVGLAYLPRLVVSLLGSAGSTLLALPERLVAPLLIRHEIPAPIFIVGMPRSGTTHLHNLLALDPQFRSPRNYEVFNPHGFLTGWLTTAVLTPFMTWRRPMDAVQMTPFTAQEEEFALAALGSPSPYWSFCLPREIDRHDRYWKPAGFTPAERARWERHFELFLRKLTVWRRRTPLLKNPANTGRVAMLKELFPNAKFVHIVRHPHAVWRSNQRLAEHGLAVFQLQDPRPTDSYATRALDNYRDLMDTYYADVQGLDASDVVQVRYEDLDQAPAETLTGIFDQLGLTRSPAFDQRLERYLESVSGYRKNRFKELPAEDRQRIDDVMAPYLEAWGYADEDRQKHAA